ncbi:hypothetical protein JCM10212_000543 [Sporobolomyces blumeae]
MAKLRKPRPAAPSTAPASASAEPSPPSPRGASSIRSVASSSSPTQLRRTSGSTPPPPLIALRSSQSKAKAIAIKPDVEVQAEFQVGRDSTIRSSSSVHSIEALASSPTSSIRTRSSIPPPPFPTQFSSTPAPGLPAAHSRTESGSTISNLPAAAGGGFERSPSLHAFPETESRTPPEEEHANQGTALAQLRQRLDSDQHARDEINSHKKGKGKGRSEGDGAGGGGGGGGGHKLRKKRRPSNVPDQGEAGNDEIGREGGGEREIEQRENKAGQDIGQIETVQHEITLVVEREPSRSPIRTKDAVQGDGGKQFEDGRNPTSEQVEAASGKGQGPLDVDEVDDGRPAEAEPLSPTFSPPVPSTHHPHRLDPTTRSSSTTTRRSTESRIRSAEVTPSSSSGSILFAPVRLGWKVASGTVQFGLATTQSAARHVPIMGRFVPGQVAHETKPSARCGRETRLDHPDQATRGKANDDDDDDDDRDEGTTEDGEARRFPSPPSTPSSQVSFAPSTASALRRHHASHLDSSPDASPPRSTSLDRVASSKESSQGGSEEHGLVYKAAELSLGLSIAGVLVTGALGKMALNKVLGRGETSQGHEKRG